MNPRRSLRAWPLAALLLAAWGFASACTSTGPARRSNLQKEMGKPEGVSATELRLRLYEMPVRLGGMLETAADRIRAESTDPSVRRRALELKADGIPALYTAALRPDPLAGGLDLWVFLYQLSSYFEAGAGRDAFGAQQPIAAAALKQMLALVEQIATTLSPDHETFLQRQARVEQFARAHPIEGSYSSRETALTELAHLMEGQASGTFAAVGVATETLEDISLRLNAYVTLLPKVVRWQAELAAEDATGRENLRGTLDDIHAIGEFALRADRLLADLPGGAREVSGPFRELLDQQRTELLAAVDWERLVMTAFVTQEREAALAAVTRERQAALASISEERAAVLAELNAMAKRSLEDASGRARGLVDYFFWRALILIAAMALLGVVAYRLARGAPRAGPDRTRMGS